MSDFGCRFYAQKKPFGRQIELTFATWAAGAWKTAAPLTMVDFVAGQEPAPFTSMHISTAQELMDSLWECGLRPSEGAGSAGALAATERHLKDMQRLVFEHDRKG